MTFGDDDDDDLSFYFLKTFFSIYLFMLTPSESLFDSLVSSLRRRLRDGHMYIHMIRKALTPPYSLQSAFFFYRYDQKLLKLNAADSFCLYIPIHSFKLALKCTSTGKKCSSNRVMIET